MTHLGERVSDFVDGQLTVEATERATAHLARCRGCRDAVESERLMKDRLCCLSGPEPTADLVGRLLAMGGPSGPLPPRSGHVPGSPRPRPVPLYPSTHGGVLLRAATSVRPGGSRPATGGSSRPATAHRVPRTRRIRLAGAVLGALGVVGAGVGGLVLTAPTGPAPGANPTLDSFVIQQRTTPPPAGRGPRILPAAVPTQSASFLTAR